MICPHCHKNLVVTSGPGNVLVCSACGAPTQRRPRAEAATLVAQASAPVAGKRRLGGSGTGQVVAEQPRLGPYKIVGELGRGGMGRVFKAVHETLRQTRAIKILTKSMGSDPRMVARFQREARIIAEVSHENIVRIFDFEQDPNRGHYYFVMEYVDGGSVSGILRRKGKLPWHQATEITLQVARGLAAMHQHRLVHRDIKPSNILIDRAGTAKLADLGLARHEGEGSDTQLTAAGAVLGTVDYIAPEQVVDPRQVDIRSDLYSLGCTLFHMLAGRVPFAEGSGYQKMEHHVHDPIPDIGPLAPDVPFQLALILNRLTEKDPANRYQTPQELIASLESLLGQGESETDDWQGSVAEQIAAIVATTTKEATPLPVTAEPSTELFIERETDPADMPAEMAAFLQVMSGETVTAELEANDTAEEEQPIDPQLEAFLHSLDQDHQSLPSRCTSHSSIGEWSARIFSLPTWAIVGIVVVAALGLLLLLWKLTV